MGKPKYLYKYEPFSVQSLKNLKTQSIYFGSPLNFNDPYDCALTVKILEPSKSDLNILKKRFISETNLNPEAIHLLESLNDEVVVAQLMSLAKNVLETVRNRFLTMRGVTCFSETNSDLLMWSHYGGRYKGFCLEFSTNHEPFEKIYKVTYASEMPQVTLASILLSNDHDFLLNFFITKSKSWEYEKEWRGIHENVGTQFTYKASALKAIYLGPDMDSESFEIIALILAGQNSNVNLWKGRRSTEKFEVLFEKIN